MANDLFRKAVAPFVRRNKWTPPQQKQHFKRLYNTFDTLGDKYRRQDLPGATDLEDVTTVSAADFQKQSGEWNNFVYQAEPGKLNRLKVWRDMSFFPDISFAVGELEDEAINFDANGNFISLDVKSERLHQNENILLNLQKEFRYIIHDVMEAHNHITDWFREYIVDGEIFFEKIVDPLTAKERGIIRTKRLRPEFTYPIWEEVESDKVHQFVHKSNGANIVLMPPEMVAYANSGIYVIQDSTTKSILSWLERAKIDYRKLKQMEDALVIYRLVRAPERRVFKIEVGNLPKAKAEAYVRELMRKYRQRKTFNPETGEAGEIYDPQAMIEDFFFPQQNGKGSSIETLPGGENLGNIDDIIYFRKKLFAGLRIPISRLSEEAGFSLGDTSDITRDEVRFFKMTQKFVNRFSEVFKQIFMSHIRLKGYADEYNIQEKDIRIVIHSDNLFQEYLESNMISVRTQNMEKLMQFAVVENEGETPLLAKKFILRKYLRLTPEEELENAKYLEMEKKEKISAPSGEGGGGSDAGGGGGSIGGVSDLGGSDSDSSSGSDPSKADTSNDSTPPDGGDTGANTSKSSSPSDKDINSFA